MSGIKKAVKHSSDPGKKTIQSLTKKEIRAEICRRSFPEFIRGAQPGLEHSFFHRGYYRLLDRFARGEIRKLMISIPPQHGKSTGSTLLLPAYLLGKNPDLRIAIASYNLLQASRFNRQIQRLMESKKYRDIFPGSRLKSPGSRESYVRTAEEFEITGRSGGVIVVGREGTLTGNPVDVMIIDDLYKDALEGNSPVVRENAWEWYTSVVKTRLHNDSRELIVMTRWHEDDLIGRLNRKEGVRQAGTTESYLPDPPSRLWTLLNYPAIKVGGPTSFDPRREGEALWPERQHSTLLQEKRALDPVTFACMYQGEPASREGLLYGERLSTYVCCPEDILKKGNYTDTADTGEDYLCSVCYVCGKDGLIYVTDVVYTPLSMEHTEEAVASMLRRNDTRVAYVESNNGGRGFGRNVSRLCPVVKIEGFTQTGNKESRILTNAATVLKYILLPSDWGVRWPEFYAHVTGYRRTFRANRYHDAADVLTGIVEREVIHKADKGLKKIRFSQ